MNTIIKYTLLFLSPICTIAQTPNILKDSITGKPIAYANIWLQNENIGISSEENGEFVFPNHDKNKKIVISAMGYKKKIVAISKSETILLQPIYTELKEVVILKKLQTKQKEIGEVDSPMHQTNENGPKIDIKFFPYDNRYKRTKFIQKISILTDCRLLDAKLKIHLYKMDENGFPSDELFQNEYIVTVKQGINNHYFDISDLNIIFPKTGVFVGFEKLLIEKNKIEKTIKDSNTNNLKTQIAYAPFVLYNVVEKDQNFVFTGGKWNKQTAENNTKLTVYEPVIKLVLSN
jgi:CarboxypepD_reg-like domain